MHNPAADVPTPGCYNLPSDFCSLITERLAAAFVRTKTASPEDTCGYLSLDPYFWTLHSNAPKA
eukprot:7010263-Pyramimonas_sp.AAC.1